MIEFTASRENARTVRHIAKISDTMRHGLRRAWFERAVNIEKEANREILRRPKSGRTYIIRTRDGRRRRHVASAPGETHANLSGTLRRSISWKVHGWETMDFGYGISTTAANPAPNYAKFVEDGTSRMEPRPSIKNAIDTTQRNAENYFEREIARAFRRPA